MWLVSIAGAMLAGPAVRISPLAVILLLASGPAIAQPPAPPTRALDRNEVERLLETSPVAQVLSAVANEAVAARVGQDLWQQSNPELQLFAGPRTGVGPKTQTDVGLVLGVPFDLSSSRHRRMGLADARVALAEADAVERYWRLRFDTLDLWVQVQGATSRIRLSQQRYDLDQKILQSVETRFHAGVIGQADVSLARAVASESLAKLRLTNGERDRLSSLLLGRLGLPGTEVTYDGHLPQLEAAPLPQLLLRVGDRPDFLRARKEQEALQADQGLQEKLGFPVPRLQGEVAKEADERFARLGVAIPVPLFQRNQTARAVAEARLKTWQAQLHAQQVQAQGEVRAAYARWQGARDAFAQMNASQTDLEQAISLSTRAYELGQTPLGQLLMARREVSIVRESTLQAQIEEARASLALEQATYSEKKAAQ
jgi:outer membrane protein, heavy metal efflux system